MECLSQYLITRIFHLITILRSYVKRVPDPIVYFDKCFGASHSKCLLKYVFSICLFLQKSEKRKKQVNLFKIQQKMGFQDCTITLVEDFSPRTTILLFLFTVFSYLCFLVSTLRRWDKSAAIQELFSFLGIGTKQSIIQMLF